MMNNKSSGTGRATIIILHHKGDITITSNTTAIQHPVFFLILSLGYVLYFSLPESIFKKK